MPMTSINPLASSSFDQEYQYAGWLLGRQTSSELNATPSPYGTSGKYRSYDYGTIHQTARYGAIAVWRDLQREYSVHQGSGGWLGFPTQREHDWSYGKRTDFEGGYINWNGQRAIAYDTGATPSPFIDDSGHGSTANWLVQFWNNQNLSGNPVWSGTNAAGELRFAATGVPSNTAGIPADHFSARWSTQSRFDGGLYDFVSQADDGIRIYIDGVKILDKWQDQPFVRNDAFVLLSSGRHTVQVDYFENLGSAANTLHWDPLNQVTNWTGGVQIVGFDGTSVHATYNNTFARDGGATVLGAPINNVHSLGNGYVQDFIGGTDGRGSVMKSNINDNSYWVGGEFWNKFVAAGGSANLLGYPTSDRTAINGGVRQTFQGGAIYKTSQGIFTVYGGIGRYYFQVAGGESGRLGLPTGGEQGIGGGVVRQNFENGYILWNGSATAYNSNGSLLFSPPQLTGSINYVNFSGVVMSTTGVNLRSSPHLNDRTTTNRGYNERLSFDAWTTGDTVTDLASNTPDNRWFRITGTSYWVPSAYVNGNPLNSSGQTIPSQNPTQIATNQLTSNGPKSNTYTPHISTITTHKTDYLEYLVARAPKTNLIDLGHAFVAVIKHDYDVQITYRDMSTVGSVMVNDKYSTVHTYSAWPKTSNDNKWVDNGTDLADMNSLLECGYVTETNEVVATRVANISESKANWIYEHGWKETGYSNYNPFAILGWEAVCTTQAVKLWENTVGEGYGVASVYTSPLSLYNQMQLKSLQTGSTLVNGGRVFQ